MTTSAPPPQHQPVAMTPYCTNWGAYNVPRLWSMLEKEDNPDAWRQVAAWGSMAESVRENRARLELAKEALITAWPPEKNPAAKAFIAELDTLLVRMDHAKRDADDTAAGLANILEALRQAKNKIEPLWQQYKDKSDDLVPNWWDHAEDELDTQARQHMGTAEQVVLGNVPQLRAPMPYRMDPPEGYGDETKRTEPGGKTPSLVSSAGSDRSSTSSIEAVAVPHDPPPPLPGHEPTIPDGPGSGGGGALSPQPSSGVGLAEVIAPPPPAAPGVQPPVGPPGGAPPPVGGLPPGVIGNPGLLPGGVPPGGARASGGGGRRPFPGGAKGAMPSGSVIGAGGSMGAPMGGAGGAAGRGRAGAVKPTPPSWLSGAAGQTNGVPGGPGAAGRGAAGRGAGRGGAGAGLTGGTGMPGASGRRRGGEREDTMQFDPDNPWETAEGVDPVIEPSRERPRHDPGPGVIGWHG